jgi:hypothetical protein
MPKNKIYINKNYTHNFNVIFNTLHHYNGCRTKTGKTQHSSVTGMQHYYTHSRAQVNTTVNARNTV